MNDNLLMPIRFQMRTRDQMLRRHTFYWRLFGKKISEKDERGVTIVGYYFKDIYLIWSADGQPVFQADVEEMQ